jgi:hypothetical protein
VSHDKEPDDGATTSMELTRANRASESKKRALSALIPLALLVTVCGCGSSHTSKTAQVTKPTQTTNSPSASASASTTASATPTKTGPVGASTPTRSSGSSNTTVTATKTPVPQPSDGPRSAAPDTASTANRASKPVNLPVNSTVRQQLISTYEAARQLGANGVSEARPGSVFYAEDPTNGNHWAIAIFNPGKALTTRQSASFQDGGNTGAFVQPVGGSWRLISTAGAPPDCTPYIPLSVRNVWAWPAGPGCGAGKGS